MVTFSAHVSANVTRRSMIRQTEDSMSEEVCLSRRRTFNHLPTGFSISKFDYAAYDNATSYSDLSHDHTLHNRMTLVAISLK